MSSQLVSVRRGLSHSGWSMWPSNGSPATACDFVGLSATGLLARMLAFCHSSRFAPIRRRRLGRRAQPLLALHDRSGPHAPSSVSSSDRIARRGIRFDSASKFFVEEPDAVPPGALSNGATRSDDTSPSASDRQSGLGGGALHTAPWRGSRAPGCQRGTREGGPPPRRAPGVGKVDAARDRFEPGPQPRSLLGEVQEVSPAKRQVQRRGREHIHRSHDIVLSRPGNASWCEKGDASPWSADHGSRS